AINFNLFRENDLGEKGFRKFFLKFENLVDGYQKGLQEEILQAINFVEQNWKNGLPSASAHLDLFPDNVFFDEKNKISGIIDFYFAANDLLIYDFAIVVNAWCFDEKNNFAEEKFLVLKNSYEKIRKFSSQENNFLKIALIAAALRFLLTRLHDMFFTPKNSHVIVKNPQEYLVKLRYFVNDKT
ncbi:MAG TPA: phosphotransferase, partial [Rickettsiales bacterium]|nr:phosphotransferase [Rickettsiales bacterium]